MNMAFSKKALESLQARYADGKIVPIIGAGFSKPFDLPNWGDLLVDVAHSFGVDSSVLKTIRAIINRQKYVEAVSTVTSVTGKTEIDIQNAVVKIIAEKKIALCKQNNVSEFSELKIDNNYIDLNRFNTLFTLNYDEIIADFNKIYSNYTISKFKSTGDIGNKKNIIYLHGRISEPKSIVLAKANYNAIYNDDDFKRKLVAFALDRTFLFMGFSFQDEYIRKFLETFTQDLDVVHYALMDKSSVELLGDEVKNIREQYKVEIIPFDDSSKRHIQEIRKFISSITTKSSDFLTYFDDSNKKGHIHSSYQLGLENQVSKLISFCKIPNRFHVLEIGSGAGHTAIKIAVSNKDCKFEALDQSKEKTQDAEDMKKRRSATNINFLLDDIQSFIENENKISKYDFIYLLYSFHHIRDGIEDFEQGQGRNSNKRLFLRNCFNNMKAGSYLCIADLFLPVEDSEEKNEVTNKAELKSFFENRAIEGKSSVFWDKLKSILEVDIIEAEENADQCNDAECSVVDGIINRRGEYLITKDWLETQAVRAGFKVVLSEKINSIGDAIVLLQKQ